VAIRVQAVFIPNCFFCCIIQSNHARTNISRGRAGRGFWAAWNSASSFAARTRASRWWTVPPPLVSPLLYQVATAAFRAGNRAASAGRFFPDRPDITVLWTKSWIRLANKKVLLEKTRSLIDYLVLALEVAPATSVIGMGTIRARAQNDRGCCAFAATLLWRLQKAENERKYRGTINF